MNNLKQKKRREKVSIKGCFGQEEEIRVSVCH